MRRFFIFDNYNTWHDWRLTLTAKSMTPPEPKTNYVDLGGMHGSLDLTEALTGEVAYGDRTLAASFWSSEGTFMERLATVQTITAALHGKKVQIVEPDDPEHYFLGRVIIKSQAHDQVHTEFSVEAICDPWRYAMNETVRYAEVGEDAPVDLVINNGGVKTVSPSITVSGTVSLSYRDQYGNRQSTKLEAGTYKLSNLQFRQGAYVVGLRGKGNVTFRYREATL